MISKLAYRLFLGFILLVALFALATAFPIPGNFQIRVVQSGSMEPAIHTGSVVVIKPAGSYAVGDVITYGRTGTPTTHRIVDMKLVEGSTSYKTKGDANDAADGSEVRHEEVIGKVRVSVPYAGYVIDAARKPIGFFFLIILPALIVAAEEAKTIWKEVMKMRKPQAAEKETNEAAS